MEQNLINQNNVSQNGNTLMNDDKQIIEAHKTKKIFEANDQEIKRILSVIGIMIGLQTPPSEIEVIILLDALRNVYPAIGIQELQLAFIMALADKLTLEKDAKEHYGILSFKYISGILAAYIRNAKSVVNKIEHAYVPPELPPPLPQSDEEFIEENFAMWFGMKNKFYQFIDHNVYEKLLKKGLIKLNEEDKIRIRATVKHDIEQSSTKRGFKELQDRLKIIQDTPDGGVYFQRQCKKYAVMEYFNKIIQEGKLKVFANEKV